MRRPRRLLALAALPFLAACTTGQDTEATVAPEPAPGLAYPDTETVEQVDVYHGVEVADPYRWLEEDVRESEAVRGWVEAQNEVTFSYLETIEERQAIFDRLRELWDYEKYTLPDKQGGRYFYKHNEGLQNQYVLYMLANLGAEPELLIDPNTWSEDGTIALAGSHPSPDGRWLAYTIQDGGSDWRTARVMDLSTRELLDEELEWLKFTGLAWSTDGDGFFYSRYPAPEAGQEFQALNKDQALYYHRVDTPQSADELVYARPDAPEWGFGAAVTDEGRWLVISIWKGTDDRNQVAVEDLAASGWAPEMLVSDFENGYSLAGSEGSTLFFRTNDAPNGRVVAIDLDDPAPERWREIVPEGEHVLRSVDRVGDHLLAEYLRDARSEVEAYDLEGGIVRTVDLPGIGSAYGFAGEAGDPETFYSYSSFNVPPTIYRYDVSSGETSVFRESEVDFDGGRYEVEQVFYRSKDGTRVPMFIVTRAGMERDGETPALLYGYGGFNASMTPGFSVTFAAWLEMGGTFALANIRGGGEYGGEWHEAGKKLNKQNVFDDFIAAAEYLVTEGYTRPEKLAVMGGSNGGLLVGAVVNQRPDLFGAALPAVGVMDMLRFHRFTAGRFWVDDYGSADDPDEFRALHAYSPYHNIRPGTEYPAVLVTTADYDDRVVPGHSFKYISRLQRAQAGAAPVLVRIETRAGHGAGKPTEKIIAEVADTWGFLVKTLGLELPESFGG
jgi:prolyl oligopeptidase